MKNVQHKYDELTWKQVLWGYANGIFPMGNDDGTISWFEANPRAILPIELPTSSIHITRSLKQVLTKSIFKIKFNTSFKEVLLSCSERKDTWINELIMDAYTELHKHGYAHSVEAWKGKKLASGLYGVAYKGAFFGESMFFRESNASKVCVVKLYEVLKKNNFILFDIQMMTEHFKTFGAKEISKRGYLEILDRAMEVERKLNI